jgi:NAD(P)H-flavin reductase
MTLPPQGNRDLLCIAGGTGLAPIKAILEAVIDSTRHARPRKMTLLFGARRQAELYDLGELRALQSVSPALSVLPVVSHEAGFDGLTGMLPDIVASRDDIEDCEIFISGPVEMVAETERALAGRVAAEHVHHDPLSELSAS